MTFDLRQTAQEKIIVVAHRGISGGNIPCNTLTSYEIALKQGADMIEIDVNMSKDGELFIFHPSMEKHHLCMDVNIPSMTAAEVRQLCFCNYDSNPTQFGLNTLDEVLERFKGRCYINCDKFWEHPKEIAEHIREHGMMEQILVKTQASKENFDVIEKYAPDVQYCVLVRDHAAEVHEELKRRNINYMGQELLFQTEDSYFCSPEYLGKLRSENILSFVNAIVYNYKTVLSAGHNDDISLTEDPEKGWGWLARKGFDMIQTDWAQMMIDYLKSQGLLYRK